VRTRCTAPTSFRSPLDTESGTRGWDTLIITGKLHSFPDLWVMGTGKVSEAQCQVARFAGRPVPGERYCRGLVLWLICTGNLSQGR